MPALDWIAVVVCVLAIAGGVAVAVVRALATWRTFRSFNRGMGAALDGVLATAAAAEAHAVGLSEGGERLTAATARLQRSLARLATIRAALGEAQQLVRRLRGAVPHK